MKETIEKLKKSPLFHLSLSSKELFHSNFLYWVACNYPSEFGYLFANYLPHETENTCISEIFREKENIDLSFSYANGQQILIENKVKSVPNIEQLQRYTQKIKSDSVNFILLSLSKPSFFESDKQEIEGKTWHYLSYSDLKVMLQKLLEKVENTYHQQIIQDYCEFVDGLLEVNECSGLKSKDKFNFHSAKSNPLLNDMRELRLHDFYLKKKYEGLALQVYANLNEQNYKPTYYEGNFDWNSKPQLISIWHGMTRGVGLMDLKHIIAPKVSLGIQIQGDSYRMVVESDKDTGIAEKIAEHLDDAGLWFDFTNTFPKAKVYPKPDKRFNKYGNSFFYKSVKLSNELIVEKIVDTVLLDVKRVNDNIDSISQIVRNFL